MTVTTEQIEQITKLVMQALDKAKCNEPSGIPVGISARHVHLTRQDVDTLFGKGHELKNIKTLMGGQYACEETVLIISEKQKAIERVRVLGPLRSFSQVEVSATDAMKLSVKVPLRDSGDIAGSAPVTIIGPCGAVHLKEGMIVAARHVHMSPKDASFFAVADGDLISVRLPGARSTILENVKVRVDPSFTLEMHIDTDEANATLVKNGNLVQIVARRQA